uniref:Deoxyribonuclease 1 like 4, tandem duplicate 2 n=1 Tax=Oryzias latipes TaxID=8090 RepID=A0A3B3IIX7_ORYLA
MKIAAFNMKNLGQKKVSDKKVVNHLIKIMSQYSIVVILEVMDKSGEAMKLLLEKLNSSSQNKESPYGMICSKSLGRDTYKEKYVCFYRTKEVELKDSKQYADDQPGDEDAFAREPFILRFSCPSTAVKDLVLIPVHTVPEDAEKELDELFDVVTEVSREWETDNIMILGDFNADGRYLSKKGKKKIRIHQPPFYWLIDDDVDTTTRTSNDNTYDRIVVHGQTLLDAVLPGSAKAFNFQEKFKLTEEEALSISDHYPVEVELLPSGQKRQAQTPKTGLCGCQTPVILRRLHFSLFSLLVNGRSWEEEENSMRMFWRQNRRIFSRNFCLLLFRLNKELLHEARLFVRLFFPSPAVSRNSHISLTLE